MQAVIVGCRSCPFPAAAAEARRDPYLSPRAGRHRLGSAGNNVGRARSPSRAEARPHGPGGISWRFHPPNNGQPITPCNYKEVSMRRDGPEGPETPPAGGPSRRTRSRGSSGPRRRVSWPSASFSSPSTGAWSSGTRSSSTPRTPRRTRSTPSSPARAGWRSPPRCSR